MLRLTQLQQARCCTLLALHRVQQPAGAQHSSLLPLAQAAPVGLTSSTDK